MPAHTLHPRLRVLRGEEIALGPGKADLLQAVAEAGTLAEAAKRLGMSYMRAWKLVQTMNACFKEPLVATTRGGSERGHATLTEAGRPSSRSTVAWRRSPSAPWNPPGRSSSATLRIEPPVSSVILDGI